MAYVTRLLLFVLVTAMAATLVLAGSDGLDEVTEKQRVTAASRLLWPSHGASRCPGAVGIVARG